MPETSQLIQGGGEMPGLGLGTWKLRGASAVSVVSTALELGYRHLDTATMYGNEAEIGQALAGMSGVFVTTKLPADRVGAGRATLESSLRALGLPRVDLWLMHWPASDIVAGWEEMLALRDEGLAAAVGVSNFSLAQLDELVAATGQAPAVNQIPWDPSRYDADLLAGHSAREVVVEGYSPFRGGSLSDPVLVGIAATHDATPAQVVVAWHLAHGVVCIPKSAQRERLAGNLAAGSLVLTAAEVAAVDALTS